VTPEKIRKSGGGRKRLEEIDDTLQSDLMKLMDDVWGSMQPIEVDMPQFT